MRAPIASIRQKAQRHLASSAVIGAAGIAALLASGLLGVARAADDTSGPASRHVYFTGGVHNDKDCVPASKCIPKRQQGEPTDPLYPIWWSSDWIMYRVFNNADKFPPPYASPPQGLTPADYQVSTGATYYDSRYVPPDHDGSGAMMEHYENFCLPIFPMKNDYSCSFVSLGNKAYFLRYDDRPPNTPQCCRFSPDNHPPRRDFIKHLPYSPVDSSHLGGTIQAYSMTPGGILFGYSFYKTPQPDSYDQKAAPYRHPQSFYFAGYPVDPPDAPIVSQNYTSFRMQRPNPAETWDQVAKICPAKPGWCCLFAGDCPDAQPASLAKIPNWSTIQP
jgi:hypothetical protein